MAVKYVIALHTLLVCQSKLGKCETGSIPCDEELSAQSFAKTLVSPNYPNNYPNNLNCNIHIRSAEHTIIELEFKVFNIEEDGDCGKDYLMVYDGTGEGQQLIRGPCGSQFDWPLYPVVKSSGNAITLNFITDAEKTWSGYEIHYRAVVPQPSIFVLAAKDRNRLQVIQRYSARNYELTPDGLQSPQGVDYDPVEGYVYYSDKGSKTIGRVLLTGEITQILHRKDISNPIALRVDVVNRLLYWSDSDTATIFVSNLEGTQRQNLITSDLDKPGAIALEPDEGYMYFTDWGYPAKIEKAEGDGTNRFTLVSTRISSPQGLAIDLKSRYLYWVDALLDTLEGVDVFGSNRVSLKQFHERDPFALVLDDDGFFFTDEEWGAIETLNRNGDDFKVSRVYIDDIREPRGITLRQLKDYGENVQYACPRKDCSGFCLPKAHGDYTCVGSDDISPVIINCPEDMVIHISKGESALVDWKEPTASDDSGRVMLTLVEGPLPGSQLGVGIFTVTYVANDPSSNIDTCTFTIAVSQEGINQAARPSDPEHKNGHLHLIFGIIVSALLLLILCTLLFLSSRCRSLPTREIPINHSLPPNYDHIPVRDSTRDRPVSSVSLEVARGSGAQYIVPATGPRDYNDASATELPPPYEAENAVNLSDERYEPPFRDNSAHRQ